MRSFLLLCVCTVMLGSFTVINSSSLTNEERKFAVDHLNKTRSELLDAVKGLSDAQLNYKPAPDRWSVLECVQHITLTSKGLLGFVQQTVKTPNDSAFKASIPDDKFITMVEDRSHKAQAPEPFKPVNATFKSLGETLKVFNADRDSLIKYVQTTNDDLRGHIAAMPFGKADAYQLVLLISAHTNRHMQQLNEVKADPNFPKK